MGKKKGKKNGKITAEFLVQAAVMGGTLGAVSQMFRNVDMEKMIEFEKKRSEYWKRIADGRLKRYKKLKLQLKRAREGK